MGSLSGMELDDKIQAPLFGFKNSMDYHKKLTCYNRIPNIIVPTLFFNSLDDTVIVKECIDYEIFHKNPNVVLATTERGGHIGYHQNIIFTKRWIDEPVLLFLNQYS